MDEVGYIIVKKNEVSGQSGLFYNYVLASNGLFLQANNPFFSTVFCIAPVDVRGLRGIDNLLFLKHGKIPRRLYDAVFNVLSADPEKECYLAIVWDERKNSYQARYPSQIETPGDVSYEKIPNTVMDIHSHCGIAFFSTTDNEDEQGFKLYMVIGRVDDAPEYRLRLGAYGYFHELDFEEVFE